MNKPFYIFVPLYHSYHLLDKFVKGLELEKNLYFKVIFWDNTDGKTIDEQSYIIEEYSKRFGVNYEFRIMLDENDNHKRLWFTQSVNAMYKVMDLNDNHDRRFLIFNPDHYPFEENWLTKMVNYWDEIEKYDNIVTLGTLQYYNETLNDVWHYGCFFKPIEDRVHPLDWWHNNAVRENPAPLKCDGNTGSGLMIDGNKFFELGMFNEIKYPHYASDSDFCLRATEKGYTHYCSDVLTIHHPGTSTLK